MEGRETVIYEMRIQSLRPGSREDYTNYFGPYADACSSYTRLWGVWHTDIGELDEVIEIWEFASLQDRFEAQGRMARDPSCQWPPKDTDFIVSRRVQILEPIEGSPVWSGPKALGGIYELRLTTYEVDVIGDVVSGFARSLPGRTAIYPAAGIFSSTLGTLHHLYQIYPFKDWNHRSEVRAEFYETGVWPPPHASVPHPLTEVVRYMTPDKHSPLH